MPAGGLCEGGRTAAGAGPAAAMDAGRLGGSRAAAAAKDWRKPGLPFGRVNPFDAEHADVALLEIGDELADGTLG